MQFAKQQIAAVATLVLASLVSAEQNPTVVLPEQQNGGYDASVPLKIRWTGATTGYVNVDCVNDNDALADPIHIGSVLADKGELDWKIPESIRSAMGYRIRVWGDHVPKTVGQDGSSKDFTLYNNIPGAVTVFTVGKPSRKAGCKVGEPCEIAWDYSPLVNGPAKVDIALFRYIPTDPDHPVRLMEIATGLDPSSKKFLWTPPAHDENLLTSQNFVAVTGEGRPLAAPLQFNMMGANSDVFPIVALTAQADATEVAAIRGKDTRESAHGKAADEEAAIPRKDAGESARRKLAEEEEAILSETGMTIEEAQKDPAAGGKTANGEAGEKSGLLTQLEANSAAAGSSYSSMWMMAVPIAMLVPYVLLF